MPMPSFKRTPALLLYQNKRPAQGVTLKEYHKSSENPKKKNPKAWYFFNVARSDVERIPPWSEVEEV